MKRKRYSPEQIIRILKEAEAGSKIIDVCRKYGISEQTFYNWRNKYGGMSISDARKLKALEKENQKLKRLVADLSLDNQVLKDLLEKNF
jgi:putative transposase